MDTDQNKLDKIAKALCLFQSKVSIIEKTKQGYGYKYADLSTIITSIKLYLKEAGLSYSQLLRKGAENVAVTTILMHESGQYLESTVEAKIDDKKNQNLSRVQIQGLITTYLRRYSLSAILGLAAEEDKDGVTEDIIKNQGANNNFQNNSYNNKLISKAQLDRLYAIALSKNKKESDISSYINSLGINSIKEIKKGKEYEDIVNWARFEKVE
jgi:hypothetical protein